MTDDTTGLDRDIAQLWTMLFEAVLEGEKRLSAHLAAHGLTAPQFYVLKTISEHGGHITIGEIARAHELTNATMTGLVKRMEALNPPLVARVVNTTDRRSVYVTLTEAGQERFLAVQQGLLEQMRALLSLLRADERQMLLQQVERYITLIIAHFPLKEDQSD